MPTCHLSQANLEGDTSILCSRQVNQSVAPRQLRQRWSRMSPDMLLLLFFLASTNLHQVTNCLRISSIEIPAAVPNGSQMTLVCNYELAAADQLYSVKWYKDFVEFYRFQPTETSEQGSTQPQKHGFDWDGVNLDLSESNSTHVHLKQVSLTTEGTFKCEVSADSPSFATVSAERQLKVYVLPKQKLTIIDNGQAQDHQSASWPLPSTSVQPESSYPTGGGELINLTCVAGASKPAPQLSWLINDIQVNSASLKASNVRALIDIVELSQASPVHQQSSLFESRSNLQLRLQPGLAHALAALSNEHDQSAGPTQSVASDWPATVRRLRLSCLARLSLEYQTETSITVSSGTGRDGVQRAGRPSQQTSSSSSATNNDELPTPLSLLDPPSGGAHKSIQLGTQQSQIWPAYRWPPQHPAPSAGAANQQRLLENGQTSQASSITRRGGPNLVVVWTHRQLRAQVELIERLLKQSRPNELEAPVIEANTLMADPGRRRSTQSGEPEDLSAIETMVSTRDDDGNNGGGDDDDDDQGNSAATADEGQHISETMRFVCSARLADSVAQADKLRELRIDWLLNERPVAGERINSFDGTKFVYNSSEKIRALNRSFAANWAQQSNQLRPGQRALLLELSAELLQLKELVLKCRTRLEHFLIEHSAHWQPVANSQALQSTLEPPPSQYIQATDETTTNGQQQARTHFRHHAASPNIGRSTSAQQQQHNNNAKRPTVIRMRQSPASKVQSSSICLCARSNILSVVCQLVALIVVVRSQQRSQQMCALA